MLLNVLKSMFARKPARATGAQAVGRASLELGVALQAQGRAAEAEAVFRRVLDQDESNGDAAHLLGVLLANEGRHGEAVPLLERAARLLPDAGEPALHLGSAYQAVNRLDEAERAFRSAISRSPSLLAAHVSLGILLRQQIRFDEARTAFDAALTLQPDSPEAWHNLGILQRDLGDPRHARTSFEKALQQLPGFNEARFSLGLALLAIGEFADGWPAYEARLQLERFACDAPPFSLPSWHGEPTDDELLVYGEQGIGDEIMFASCLPDLVKRCPNVVLICSEKLLVLLQTSFPQLRVVPHSAGNSRDLFARSRRMVALGTLPSYFRNRLGDFPQHTGYLRSDPTLVAEYRTRLAALGGTLKVGISWRGGTDGTGRAFRSVDVGSMMAALDLPGVSLVNLQYDVGATAAEIEPYTTSGALVHWPDALDDYARTAALVCSLDVVVSVCTAVIHLAGALGRPTLVMAPFNPEWRYGCEGMRMPWYPSIRIFRQTTAFDWQRVLSDVRGQLIAQRDVRN